MGDVLEGRKATQLAIHYYELQLHNLAAINGIDMQER